MKTLTAGLMLLVLAATASALHNEAHERTQKLSEKDRRASFTLLLVKSGEKCDSVTRTFYQGSYAATGAAFWNVACKNGKTFLIEIEADAEGSTRIMSCAMLEAVKAGHCFTKFK